MIGRASTGARLARRRLGTIAAAGLLAAAFLVAPAASTPSTVDLLIGHDPAWDGGTYADRLATLDAGISRLTVDAAAVARTSAALSGDPAVRIVEPDAGITAAADPLLDLQWGLENRGGDVGGRPMVAGLDVAAVDAWLHAGHGSGVTIAILDTGIDIGHEDLADRVWRNPGEVAGNGVDDDANGYVDDVYGWDFVADAPTSATRAGDHGTHVAGTAVAAANGVGGRGAAPGARVMALRVLTSSGSGVVGDVVAALAYARDNGADLVNASWGGPGNRIMLRDGIRAAGLPVVAAAGNRLGLDCSDLDRCPVYPAALDEPLVLSVASIEGDGSLSNFSNHGRTTVDVAAPGRDILSTIRGGYGYSDGTSMSAPLVSGVVALAMSVDAGGRSGPEILQQVSATARPVKGLDAWVATGGIPDALALVRSVASSPACPPGTVDPSPFADVSRGSVHAPGVACTAGLGVARGTTASTFSPLRSVTRGQMATFIGRVLERAGVRRTSSTDHFRDDDGTTHEAAIDLLADHGIAQGFRPGVYDPNGSVTRGQMATFLLRTYGVLGGAAPIGTDRFTDDDATTHEPAIEQLAELAVTKGVTRTRFEPRSPVRRDQMATFLHRFLDVLTVEGRV